MTKKHQKGFTLIELLVVIAIIGLLSTLAVVSLNGARSKARDARRTSDLKATQSAIEIYRDDNNDKVMDIPADPNDTWIDAIDSVNDAANIYLPAGAPLDPDITRTDNKTYIYCVNDTQTFYLLRAVLENPPPGGTMSGEITSTYTCVHKTDTITRDAINALGDCGATVVDYGSIFCLGKL